MRTGFNAVWERIMSKLKRFEQERRVGKVSYDGENKAIVFHRDEAAREYRYRIPFDELRDYEGQLRRLYHIRGKGWFDAGYLNDFPDVLEYSGLRPPA